MLKEKRNKHADFSQHELSIVKNDLITIHRLKHPKYEQMLSVRFINTCGMLIIDGDYDRWSFNREFMPSPDGSVSDSYWIEKLCMGSTQKGTRFSPENTLNELSKAIDFELEEYGYKGEKLEEAKEFFDHLKSYCENEHEYVSEAYYGCEKPNFMDSEEIPFVEEVIPQLQIVFDAFEEICYRLKVEKEKENGDFNEKI